MTARFSFALLLLSLIVVAGCASRAETPTPAQPKVDIRMGVAQWHAEFGKDPKAAAAKYKGKVIELAGEVELVSEDLTENVGCVYLKVDGAPLQNRCTMRDRKPWLRVAPGSMVKICGTVPENGLPGDLAAAEIVEAGPNPAVAITADQLAKAYGNDAKSAAEKFDDRWANLQGEVLEKSKAKDCAYQLKLKGEGEIVVSCCFSERTAKCLDAVKPGSRVKVFGQLSLWKPKEIFVYSCVLSEAN